MNQKTIKTNITAIIVVITVFTATLNTFGYTDMQADRNYTYDKKGEAVYIPDAYNYTRTVRLIDSLGTSASNPQDFYLSDDNKIYIVDTDNNRIMVYDESFEYIKEISEIRSPDGKMTSLNKPEGIYVYHNNDILIADTQNNRIVRCDIDGNAAAIMGKPADMTGIDGQSSFLPVKICSDNIGRLNVVVRNINFGIVQLDSKGIFLSYIGAPIVQPDLFTLFWRKLSTKAQRDQMLQFVATEYSNLYIDDENFIWGSISTLNTDSLKDAVNKKDRSGFIAPIRKLNSMGNDVLKRNGLFAPLGDLEFKDTPSKIIDVAVGANGIYSLLDISKGHIFNYDSNGNLLYIFGNLGNNKSNFRNPTAIGYIGDQIAVLDSGLNQIQLFNPTQYGKLVIRAVASQYKGDFAEAYDIWSQVASQNTNFEYAFVGLGNAKLNNKEYSDALSNFRFASDQQNYSNSFILLRKQVMQIYFPIIFSSLLILVMILILYSVYRKLRRYYKGEYSDEYNKE